jgi:hypothetical protein
VLLDELRYKLLLNLHAWIGNNGIMKETLPLVRWCNAVELVSILCRRTTDSPGTTFSGLVNSCNMSLEHNIYVALQNDICSTAVRDTTIQAQILSKRIWSTFFKLPVV